MISNDYVFTQFGVFKIDVNRNPWNIMCAPCKVTITEDYVMIDGAQNIKAWVERNYEGTVGEASIQQIHLQCDDTYIEMDWKVVPLTLEDGSVVRITEYGYVLGVTGWYDGKYVPGIYELDGIFQSCFLFGESCLSQLDGTGLKVVSVPIERTDAVGLSFYLAKDCKSDTVPL